MPKLILISIIATAVTLGQCPTDRAWAGPELVAQGDFYGVYGARGYGAYIVNHVAIHDMRASKIVEVGPLIVGQQLLPAQIPEGVGADGSLAIVLIHGVIGLTTERLIDQPKWFPPLDSLMVRGRFAATFDDGAVVYRDGVPLGTVPHFYSTNCGLSPSNGSLYWLVRGKRGPLVITARFVRGRVAYKSMPLEASGLKGPSGDDKPEEVNDTTLATRFNFEEDGHLSSYLTLIDLASGKCTRLLKLFDWTGFDSSSIAVNCAFVAVPQTNEILVERDDGLYRFRYTSMGPAKKSGRTVPTTLSMFLGSGTVITKKIGRRTGKLC